MKKKMIICTTVPSSLCFFKGQVQILKQDFDTIYLSSPGQELDAFCQEEQVRKIPITMKREIHILKDVLALIQLLKAFLHEQPDIIHTNTPKVSLLGQIAGYLCRIPKRVYYVHGLRYESENGIFLWFLKMCERIACRCSTDIIAVSYGVKKKLRSDQITAKPIHLIHHGTINGIDLAHYNCNDIKCDVRKRYCISDSDFVFGYVGRIVKDKGLNELIECFRKVSRTNKQVFLFLIGPIEKELCDLNKCTVDQMHNNKQIITTGHIPDVRIFLKAFDVFLLPSYREGFNNAFLEALAMNIPCICSDISGCNDAIIPNWNGLLVEPKCTDALYKAMQRVMSDNQYLLSLKQNCRKSVEQNYNQVTIWRQSSNFYKHITKSL